MGRSGTFVRRACIALVAPIKNLFIPDPHPYDRTDSTRAGAGQTFVDGTLGGGGHTRLLAKAVGATGLVLALDRDPAAVKRASDELREFPVRALHANYSDLPEILASLNVNAVNGILLDLGLS